MIPDQDRTHLAWYVFDAGHDDDGEPCYFPGMPFDTFGRAKHTRQDDLVYPAELGIEEFWSDDDGNQHRNPWGLDPEIAELVIALNRAGIKTIQSCQDVYSLDREADDDIPRMGMILVTWDTFPKVGATLPKGAGKGDGDGWVCAADPSAQYVSIIFPWRDLDSWMDALNGRQS